MKKQDFSQICKKKKQEKTKNEKLHKIYSYPAREIQSLTAEILENYTSSQKVDKNYSHPPARAKQCLTAEILENHTSSQKVDKNYSHPPARAKQLLTSKLCNERQLRQLSPRSKLSVHNFVQPPISSEDAETFKKKYLLSKTKISLDSQHL